MNTIKQFVAMTLCAMLFCSAQAAGDKIALGIILGSTRQGRTSERVGAMLKDMLAKRTDVHAEVIDIKSYNLPVLYEEIAPAYRTVINDPIIKKWSEKIASMQAFVIVTPEYNSGYPGVLKNALDLLYKEWNHKPVAFVGYSGGPSGAEHAIAQLRQVAAALQMTPMEVTIRIPAAWKAFDAHGTLVNSIDAQFDCMVDQLVAASRSGQ